MEGTFDFSILKEDVKEGIDFTNSQNCPFAEAFRRQFPNIENFDAGVQHIYTEPNWLTVLARLDDEFSYDRFIALKKGEEFHTKITFI